MQRHCPNCKEPREASKQLSFWRLPQILVLQLKRFKRGIHSHEKISCPIYFPLQGLEFRDLVDFRFDDESIIKESIYDLYGVVNHQGIPSYGHYFAYARQSHEKNGKFNLEISDLIFHLIIFHHRLEDMR